MAKPFLHDFKLCADASSQSRIHMPPNSIACTYLRRIICPDCGRGAAYFRIANQLLCGTADFSSISLELRREADGSSQLRVDPVHSCLSTAHATHQVYFCLLPRRFFIDELFCGVSGGGATESLRFNMVSRTMCFAGLVSPSLRSSNKRAAVVPS